MRKRSIVIDKQQPSSGRVANPNRRRILLAAATLATAFSFGGVSRAVVHAASPTYDFGSYGGLSGLISNFDTSLIEPNTDPYVEYCGPAASRVLISAWTNNVPTLDTLAAQEKTNQDKVGTWMSDMVDPVNQAIGQNYYQSFAANSQGEFSNRIGWNIWQMNRPLITALQTADGNGNALNGWNSKNTGIDHIVMIYGFDFRSPSIASIDYFETAGTDAGTSNTGINTIDYGLFWSLVWLNNIQLFGV
jgi:Peptidase_C39 like family